MQPGDFVWFRKNNDMYSGDPFEETTVKIPGMIIESVKYIDDEILWIAALPIKNNPTLPMWFIPRNAVTRMKDEEAMLAMLEN